LRVRPQRIVKPAVDFEEVVVPTSRHVTTTEIPNDCFIKVAISKSNGSAGEPWPAGPSVPSAGSTAAGGRNQRGSPADPFARPSAVGRTIEYTDH